MYKDGGSIMYKNNDIAILKCNTVSGNKDIYIGKSNLRYESDYCKWHIIKVWHQKRARLIKIVVCSFFYLVKYFFKSEFLIKIFTY